jgi:regulator of replication initiation timing
MMGILTYIRSAVGIATILIVSGLLAWGLRVDHLRGVWKEKFAELSDQADRVVAAVRIVSDNPKLQWKDTADQVEQIGGALSQWRGTARSQSELIDTMGRDTERLRAENDALKEKVKALNAKRAALIGQLRQDALDPGDRADCWAQLRETEDALNQLYREGF